MAKYIAHIKTWLSHENRLVQPGEVFDTEFPDEMLLSGNIELIVPKPTRTRRTVTETDMNDDQTDVASNTTEKEI